MKTIYKSFDDTSFDNPYDCARHDLNNEQLLMSIESSLIGTSEKYQTHHWTEEKKDNVSYQFMLLGLNQYHWQIWKDEIHVPHLTEEVPTQCVIVSNFNHNPIVRSHLIELLKEGCNLPLEDTLAVFRNKKQIVANQLPLALATHLCEQFTRFGCISTVANAQTQV